MVKLNCINRKRTASMYVCLTSLFSPLTAINDVSTQNMEKHSSFKGVVVGGLLGVSSTQQYFRLLSHVYRASSPAASHTNTPVSRFTCVSQQFKDTWTCQKTHKQRQTLTQERHLEQNLMRSPSTWDSCPRVGIEVLGSKRQIIRNKRKVRTTGRERLAKNSDASHWRSRWKRRTQVRAREAVHLCIQCWARPCV